MNAASTSTATGRDANDNVEAKDLIDKKILSLEKRLLDLHNNTLPEYVEKCAAFEAERQEQIHLATLHYDLQIKNVEQLLEFDLQQIEDEDREKKIKMQHRKRSFTSSISSLQSSPASKYRSIDPCEYKIPVISCEEDMIESFQVLEKNKKMCFNMGHMVHMESNVVTILEQLRHVRRAWLSAHSRLKSKGKFRRRLY
jgi:hypothetical protein